MAEAIPGIMSAIGTNKAASAATRQAGEEQGRENFRTNEAVRQRRRESRDLKGAQAALVGASGVAFSGSPLEIFKETARVGLEDETFIRAGGDSNILKRTKRRASAQRTQAIGTLITSVNKIPKKNPTKIK